MPSWIMLAVILRDALILFGCLVVYRMTRNTGFKPTFLGKANTLIELLVVTWFLTSSRIPSLREALPALYVVALVSIFASAGDYVLQGIRMVRDPSQAARV
jgi:phosphatidylglycerophosphate synthase